MSCPELKYNVEQKVEKIFVSTATGPGIVYCTFPQVICNSTLSFVLSSVSSLGASLLKRPFASALSNIAILLVRIRDSFLRPFSESGNKAMSVGSRQPICVVIKQTVYRVLYRQAQLLVLICCRLSH